MPLSTEKTGARQHMGWVASALVGVVALGVFWSAQHGEFLMWDDDINIVTNPHLERLSWENLEWMFTDSQRSLRYTPLAWLGWALTVAGFGLNAAAFHWGNMVFHAANAVLVYRLIALLLERSESAEENGPATVVAAGLGALAWALHPLRVEVVAWATARTYAQAIFFLLWAAIAYVKYARASVGARGRRRWYGVAVAAFGASLLTYPLAVGFVPVLWVVDVWVLGRLGGSDGKAWKRKLGPMIWDKIPFAAATAGMVAVTLWTRAHAAGLWEPLPTLDQFGLGARAVQAFYIWGYFAWKQLLPFGLGPVYTTLVEFSPWEPRFLVSVLGVVAVSAGVWWKRRSWPGLLALWVCHLVLLVPTLGLTEHPYFTSDRYSYLVALPWAVAFAGMIAWAARGRRRVWVWGPGVLVIAGCAYASVRQVTVWRDSESLFRHVLSQLGAQPYRAGMAMRLGEVLRVQNRDAEATAFFQDALSVNPNLDYAHTGLAKIFEKQGRRDLVIAHCRQLVRLAPGNAEAHAQLGSLLFTEGRLTEALAVLENAVRIAPQRASTRADLCAALLQTGRVAEAIEHGEAALRIEPRNVAAQANLGAALAVAGRHGEAVAHYEGALKLSPERADIRCNLADTLRALRRLDEAVWHYREVLRVQPEHGAAHVGLGVVWLMAARYPDAIPHFVQAIRLQPGVAGNYLNLGLAFRETGRIQEARAQFEAALRVQPGYSPALEALAGLSGR
jgi:tetratricopeptide (TPR) repeat protein